MDSKQLLLQIDKLSTFSEKLIKEIIFYWYDKEGKKLFEDNLLLNRKNSGEILRIDHTYSAVSSLSTYHKGVLLSMKASLFLVLNTYKEVIYYQIVPNDTRHYVTDAL